MIPLPYVLGALVAVFILGCANGYAIRDGAAKAAAAKSYKAAEAQRAEMQGEIDVISARYEELKETTNRKYVERTNTVREFYGKGPAVDPNCALADHMFRLLSDNVRDANAAASGELGADMPDPTPTTKARN